MIKESERFAAKDKLIREKLEAKKSLEDYLSSMKNTVLAASENQLSTKISRSDLSLIEDSIKDQ